jgi:hypothetical protein
MASFFEEDRFSLHENPHLNRTFLMCKLTEEKVYLPDNSWALSHDDDQKAYIQPCGGESSYCEEWMDNIVFEFPEDSGKLRVNFANGEHRRTLSLEEYQQRHRPHKVPLNIIGHALLVGFDVFALHSSVGGAWVLWSLSSMFGQIITGVDTTCASWYHNWWPWWRKILEKLGMDPAKHLRKPMMINVGSKAAEMDPLRFLHVPVLSSYAVIALLTRWGNISKGSVAKNEETRQAWRLLRESMFKKFIVCHEFVELCFYIDSAAVATPGLPLQGLNGIRLPVRNGNMDLTPFASSDLPMLSCIPTKFQHLEDLSAVPISEVCDVIEAGGRSTHCLWMQMVVSLGAMIEQSIICNLAVVEPDEVFVSESHLLAGTAERQRMGRLLRFQSKMKIAPQCTVDMCLRLLQFFFAIRCAFVNLRCFSLACDASRLGGLNRMIGFVARPDNVGGFLQPVASLWGTIF